MHTEEEAKKKECKLMTLALFIKMDVLLNVPPKEITPAIVCTGSECMMWQWRGDTPKEAKAMNMNPENCDGYCGLTK